MSILVKNKDQVFKSLAVWLPFIASGLFTLFQYLSTAPFIPLAWLPAIVMISSVLGWVIKQPNMRK